MSLLHILSHFLISDYFLFDNVGSLSIMEQAMEEALMEMDDYNQRRVVPDALSFARRLVKSSDTLLFA